MKKFFIILMLLIPNLFTCAEIAKAGTENDNISVNVGITFKDEETFLESVTNEKLPKTSSSLEKGVVGIGLLLLLSSFLIKKIIKQKNGCT